jgi:D-glycero-D-manno-heptose 1,7-bisphosphate phosphatase
MSTKKKLNKAVFLDRDGTINEEVGYLNHIDRFRLLPRAGEAIRLLNEHGIKAVVVTNQSGVARGYFPESLVQDVHRKMEVLLEAEGARLDGVYYCPHHPEAGDPAYRQRCRCRKPGPGMMEQALSDLDLSAAGHYMVGDRSGDMEFAREINARSVLVLTGYGKGEWELTGDQWKARPDRIVEDLYEAVQWILEQESIKIGKRPKKQAFKGARVQGNRK